MWLTSVQKHGKLNQDSRTKENSTPAGTQSAASCVYTEYDAQKHDTLVLSFDTIIVSHFWARFKLAYFTKCEVCCSMTELFFWLLNR